MSGERGLVAALVAGTALVVVTRWLLPLAPAMYDGIAPASPEPYRYASPPPDLVAGNKPPASVDGVLKFVEGSSLAHALQTSDNQLLVSFNDGAFKLSGISQLHVHIAAVAQPPPAPAGSALVGNVYEVAVTDYQAVSPSSAAGSVDLPAQPPIAGAVQALMRIPPLAYNNVRLYYGGAWHDIGNSWGAQGDYVAVSPLTHLGLVGAFNDARKPPIKPKQPFPVALVEIGLTVVALGVIAAGILVQLRRRTGPP